MIDQESEILEGGHRFVRRWSQTIRTEEGPLRDQVYGLLQMTWNMHESFGVVRIDYVDDDDTVLGSLVADVAARRAIRDFEAPAEELRGRMAEDSLPDMDIPVVIRRFPRPA